MKNNSDTDPYFDWFEARTQVTNSFISPYPGKDDLDRDGINMTMEQKYYNFGTNIFFKDIFVEADWMKGECSSYETGGEFINCRMEETAQNLVIIAFGKNDITLHIDDGCMGGGEPIPYKKEIKRAPEYVKKGYFDNEKTDFFYYVVMCDELEGGARGRSSGGEFALSSKYNTAEKQAHGFTHELGHDIIYAYADHMKDTDWFNSYGNRWELDKWGWLLYLGSDVKGIHCTNHCCTLYPFGMAHGDPIDYCEDCWTNIILDWR